MRCKDRDEFVDFGIKRFIPSMFYGKDTKISYEIYKLRTDPMRIIDLSNRIMEEYDNNK